MRKLWLALAAIPLLVTAPAQAANSVFLEELTWMEVKQRIEGGARIAIIPTGGTEQNGPQLAGGKHNFIVRYTSGEIARKLGNALVAPVLAYVPEGRIEPPEGHMNFPGTISVSEQTFAAILEDAARSLKQNGFKLICFVGDNGGNQSVQQQVAAKLSSEWADRGVTVLHVSDYYDSHNGQEKWVKSLSIPVKNPAAHAGFMDTAELMSVYPQGVRRDHMGVRGEDDYKTTGAVGDSSQATPDYGKRLLSLKIDAAVRQISEVAHSAR